MSFEIARYLNLSADAIETDEIIRCNDATQKYRLTLTLSQAHELLQTRAAALKNSDRIELRGGTISGIIKAFASSPYLTMNNYAQMINELTELFYYYKTELAEALDDAELILYMREHFNGRYGGTIELLTDALERLVRAVRTGNDVDDDDMYEDDACDGEDDYD